MIITKYILSGLMVSTLSFGAVVDTVRAEVQQNPPPASPPSQEEPSTQTRGELWTGALYSSKYRAGACIDESGKVHGVLILTLKDGKEDVYHFQGSKDIQGIFRLKHSSGHAFKGNFTSATGIEGKVKTKNGFTVKLKGKREQNAVLNGPTCRPF